MPEVAWTADNAKTCLCSGCPVQAASACVAGLQGKKAAAMAAGMDQMPAAKELAGLYCSSGKATCEDLDFSKNCLCMGCPVYRANGLDEWKYCERGSAAEIG